MKKVLITAYAVDPYKGSEDGTGWNISKSLSENYNVTVITRKNNAPNIENYLEENPNTNLNFEYFDLPNWAMWWKKKIGERGYVLYYFLWQFFIIFFIKRKKIKFDISHSLNFHSDTHPHFLWMFNKPSFWGPIGHHKKVKFGFVFPFYGWKDSFKDLIYNCFKWLLSRTNPFFYICLWRSKKVFVINSKIKHRITPFQNKSIVLPAVAFETNFKQPIKSFTKDTFNILSIGRFTYIKGFDLTIKSFAHFLNTINSEEKSKIKLTIIGKGEAKNKLKSLIKELNIEDNIEIISWIKYEKIKEYYKKADTFLFPSHEGAGMVVIEAMYYGLPIICLDNEGPGELAGNSSIKIKIEKNKETIINLSKAINQIYQQIDKRVKLSKQGQSRSTNQFTWKNKAEVIALEYEKHSK